MPLWNDKRTPKGVITNSDNGRSSTLPSSIPASRAPQARSAPVSPSAEQRRERYLTNPMPVKVERGPVRQTRVAPSSAPIGKVPVDKPSNASAAAGVRQDKRNVKGSAASGKPAPRARR